MESTKVYRAFRANRHILPIAFQIRQYDGSYLTQYVDADVRLDKNRGNRRRDRVRDMEGHNDE